MTEPDRGFDPQFTDAARRFFLEILHEDEIATANISVTLRKHFPDVSSSPDAERNVLRYLGANFFRIIGVKQPAQANTHRRVIGQFVADEHARQSSLDKPTRLM